MRWLEETFKEEQDNNYPHPLKLLNAAELKEYVGSDIYLGGMYNATGGGHLHPTNLCLGEVGAAAAHGAALFEQSRVLRIDYGTPSILHTEQGSVKAKKVVLCGNAYMENLVPKLAKRVLPASTCVVATTQLSESLANSILPKNVAVCDPRTALDYLDLPQIEDCYSVAYPTTQAWFQVTIKTLCTKRCLRYTHNLKALKLITLGMDKWELESIECRNLESLRIMSILSKHIPVMESLPHT